MEETKLIDGIETMRLHVIQQIATRLLGNAHGLSDTDLEKRMRWAYATAYDIVSKLGKAEVSAES